ncbi:interleukin-1 receptor type 1-like [Aplochiton taeniatus]
MLSSSLLSQTVFNYSSVPFNISWYDSQTARELTNETGRTVVLGESLWFLNTVLDDTGDYVCIVRTHSQCYEEHTKLIVQRPINCGRPNKTTQSVPISSSGILSCPLMSEVERLKRFSIPYNIQWYKVSSAKEDDLNVNYTCSATSMMGRASQYFTLLPADPDHTLSIWVLLTGLVAFLTACLLTYKLFKVDIVLWFRETSSSLYSKRELDGKLYDAYVAYPQLFGGETTREVEMFALHTLPQVLEKKCGYKLFIFDRDSQPGQAIVESADESMQASRRLLLLYTASTFSSTKTSPGRDSVSRDQELPESGQQYERVAAMHRALLEGSLQVVLVELEEVTPTQLALFPESVRHLRERQGAVCWWKSQRSEGRWRRCFGRGAEKKAGELDVSSRFWKEMRYQMPVRCKRRTYQESNSLLNA